MSSTRPGEPSQYIHGTSPEEQARLSRLNDLLNDMAIREMALAGGELVLDVGSGLGQLTRAIARKIGPAGSVIGIERSREQLAEAQRLAAQSGEDRLAEFREGQAERLPLAEDGRYR